jgi:predicted nuclease of predicted toxin-antitoxin system
VIKGPDRSFEDSGRQEDCRLSYRLLSELEPAFPGSAHVDAVGLHAQADSAIWNFARDNSFIIVSKDDDFRQLSFLYGAPPKVIWLSIGNATTVTILRVLNGRRSLIEAFVREPVESLLILESPEKPLNRHFMGSE